MKRRASSMASSLVLLLGAGLVGSTMPARADVPPPGQAEPRHGVVMESRSQSAIAGVRVRAMVLEPECSRQINLRDTTVTTNERGGYHLPLGGCRAFVRFEKPGYRRLTVRWPEDLSPDGSVCNCVELNVIRLARVDDPDPPDPDASPDDALVYEAVLTHTIRPEAARLLAILKPDTLPPVVVIDRTIAMCREGVPHDNQMGCATESDIGLVALADTQPWGVFSGLIDAPTREELVSGFRTRNAVSHPIPAGLGDGVIRIPQEMLAQAVDAESRRPLDKVGLSCPSYSADGHAIVYAVYSCGSLCGKYWFFLLERRKGKWRVESVALIGMS